MLLCSLWNLLHLDVITHSANASSAYFMPGLRVWWPGQSVTATALTEFTSEEVLFAVLAKAIELGF